MTKRCRQQAQFSQSRVICHMQQDNGDDDHTQTWQHQASKLGPRTIPSKLAGLVQTSLPEPWRRPLRVPFDTSMDGYTLAKMTPESILVANQRQSQDLVQQFIHSLPVMIAHNMNVQCANRTLVSLS